MSKHAIQCWNCGTRLTLDERSENDGDCIECGVELALDDYFDQAVTENEQLRAELAALKAGQGEADDYAAFEAFMEINGSVNEPRAMQYMLWKQGRNAPPVPADARSVPVDILERVVSQFEDDCTSFSYDVDDIRAILAQSQGVKP